MTRAQLLADKALLTRVLTDHAASGRVPSSAVSNGLEATSLQGGRFTANVGSGRVPITDARARTANVEAFGLAASNGVSRVHDRVILP